MTRLKLYRRFYQQQKGIGPTVSAQLASLAYGDGIFAIRPTTPDESVSLLPAASRPLENAIALLEDQFPLSWSHYVTLITIYNSETRRFYEIEAAQNQWSVREMSDRSPVPCMNGSPSAVIRGKFAGSPAKGR